MVLDLVVAVGSEPPLYVAFHESGYEILCIFADVLFKPKHSVVDVVVERGNIVAVVGGLSRQALVHHHPNAVEVGLFAAAFLIQHFGSEIGWTSAEALGLVSHVILAQAEIGEFNMAFLVKQNIFRLHVPIENALAVEMLERKQKLYDIYPGVRLGEGDLARQVEAEILAGTVVEGQVEVVGGLEGVV